MRTEVGFVRSEVVKDEHGAIQHKSPREERRSMHGAPLLLSAPGHTTSTQEHKAMTVMCTAPRAILAPFVISTHPFKAGLPGQSGFYTVIIT